MNTVGFCKTQLQTTPPINQNPLNAQIINQIQYQTAYIQKNIQHLSPRQLRQMKFRKWQADDYFVQIGHEILRLGKKRWEGLEGSLQGGVKVSYKWAMYNWAIEFENLMHWAKTDTNHLSGGNNFSFNHHQQPYTTYNHNDKQTHRSSNLLEIQQQYINQIETIKNKNDLQRLKLGKCLEFLISNLSTTQFYALQFFLKLLKISQFYANMKAFSQAVSRFQSQYSFFNNQYDSVVNAKNGSKNQQKQSAKVVDQYGQVFYNKNKPQLNRIKSEILNIIQNYQLSLMTSDMNSNWYEIQLCIKLLRIQIYKQQLPVQQKQQQFDFVIFNSGIDQTLTKITQIRMRDKNESFLRKKTLSVTSLIKINDQILDVATEMVQASMNNRMKLNEDSSLQITTSVHEINSQNSNFILEQQTKKIPSTQPHIDTLGFSKSFQVSNSNHLLQQNKQLFDIQQQQIDIKESGEQQQQQQQQIENNLLEMLQDEKTIRENFSLLSVSEIKKVKRIKKMSRRKQLYKFQCINGKITFTDQLKDQHNQQNDIHSIRNKYKQKRLQQLQDRKRHHCKEQSMTKLDSLIEEENKQHNQQKHIDHNLNDNSPVERKKYQSQIPHKESHQCKRDGKQKLVNGLKKQSTYKNNSNPLPIHQYTQNNHPNNKFSTPVKDNNKQNIGFAPIPCNQNQPHSNHINAIQSRVEKPNYLLCQKKNQEENCSLFMKKDDSNFKSLSNQKTINFKETYKFANNRFAPLSKPAYSGNRFNPKMNFIKKNKNYSQTPRPSLQPNNLQINYFKKLHQQKFDTQFVTSFEEDEFLVDETPPKYKKMKVGNE